jgi:adenosine kinase
MQIFISGSLAYDRIMDFPGKFEDHILPEKLHILNVCFTVNGMSEKFGGTAGNIAYSLALLGERPTILSTAGKDFEQYHQHLRDLDLPLEGIRFIQDLPTAGAYITTDMSDNQITGFNPGALNFTSQYRFEGVPADDTLAIIAPGNTEDMRIYSDQYKELGVPYIFDPGQMITALSGEELKQMITGAEIFISNDYELELVTRATGWNNGDLLGKCRTIITTLGEKGSVLETREGTTKIPPATADAVKDPTGAGDAYRAGLIKGLADKKELAEACRMGAACASFAVEKPGTQEHWFDMEQFNKRCHSIG